MTEPAEGSSGGVSWIDVAASAVGIERSMKAIGERASTALVGSMRAGLAARGAALGDELLAGLDKTSQASMVGASIGEAIGKGIGAPLQLVREAFSGLGRDGTASAQALTREYNNVSDAFRRGEASLKALNTEAKRATEAGGAFDSTQILRVTTSVDELRQRQSDLAAQIRASDEAAKSAGSSFNVSGLAAGVMGGAISAGAIIGIESFDELISKATELGDKLLDTGEIQEGINRRLQTTTAATGEQLESLSQTVNRVAGNTAAGFDVITDATAALSTRLHLTGAPLDELVQKVSNASVILGQPIDVNAFTAAMHALGVSGADAGTELDTLFKISRASHENLNELIADLGTNASVLSAFGLNADQSARLLAGLSEAGIKSSTVIRGLNPLVKQAEKAHESFGDRLKEVVQHIQDAHDAWLKLHDQADLDTENYWASKLGPRAAIAFKQAVDDGTLSVQSLNGALGDLPAGGIDDVAESTRTLSDRLTIIGHQIDADLGPLGEVLQASLGDSLTKIGTWISSNTPTIIGFLSSIGTIAIEVGGQIAGALANITGMIGSLEAAYGALTGNDQTKKAGEHLQDLGQQMSNLGDHTDRAVKAFQDLLDKAQATAAISQDLKTALKVGTDGQLQLGDPNSVDALRKAGVDLQDNAGKFTINVDTDEAAKTVKDLLASIPAAKDIPVTVIPKVAPPSPAPAAPPAASPSAPSQPSGTPGPPDSFDWLNPFGIGENSQGFDILDPWGIFQNRDDDFRNRLNSQPPSNGGRGRNMPRAHPSGYGTDTGVPTNLTVQPASVKLGLGDVLDAAGLPSSVSDPSKGVVLNTAMQVKPNATLDVDTTMTSAGIDTSLQGALPDSSGDGVLLPTAFDTSKPGPRLSVSELMQSVGIPESNQGDSGVTLDVSYNAPTSSPGAVPAGFPSGVPGTGGQVGVPASGSKGDVARAIHDAVVAAGYTEQTADYAVAASDYESSLSPDITNASGHHGLFQESSDKPSNGAQQQIQWFLSELQRQGGPAAVNAYPGGPGNFIADKIEVGGYPGSNYNSFLSQVPGLIAGGQPPTAAPGGAAPPTTAGTGGLPGASISYTPDWLLSHGIRPIFEKNPNDSGGAATPGEIPAWVTQLGAQFDLTPKDHGDKTLHGGIAGPGNTIDKNASWAFDFFGAPQNMQKFADYLSQNYAQQLVQLIHQDPTTGRDTGVAGGQVLPQGAYYTTPGGSYLDESDEVHVAFASPIGPGGPTSPTIQAAGFQVGGQSNIIDVNRISTNPGNPQIAAPTAPGSDYSQVAPPPGMTPAPPGAANTVQVPGYGAYQFSWDLPPDEQAKARAEGKTRRMDRKSSRSD